MNIVTGRVVTHPSINVYNVVPIGHTQVESFQKTWPEGFHNNIPRVINTMAFSCKHLKMGTVNVFNTETIYARAMALQGDLIALHRQTFGS